MLNSESDSETSLDFEIRLTARVLTHKLSTCCSSAQGGASYLDSVGLASVSRFVPKFPTNELWKILNSINNKSFINHEVIKNIGDCASGVCQTTEARSCVGEEEEKHSVKESVVGSFSLPSKPSNIDKKGDSPGTNRSILVPTPVTPEEKDEKVHRYEKKNIYYKAVFRDIRRYFIEQLKQSSNYNQFEESITCMLRTENEKLGIKEVTQMTGILAPFLNYNKYLIEFEHKSVKDAQCILDCLQNFTLTKMRKVLKYPAIKFAVRYYYKHTVSGEISERLNGHKTMKKDPAKYLEVLRKIVQISENI